MFSADWQRVAECDMVTVALTVIEGGQVYFVRTDHIGRPVFATTSTGTQVWTASYLPFGGVHVMTGAPIDLRFPGQWFQAEAGLHQNWMRDYDPTTGRYIEADPLGLVDGASVYGYVGGNPLRWIDPRGEQEIAFNPGLTGEFRPELTGAEKFWKNYNDMKDANWKKSDKYFHCKANCEATQCVAVEDSVATGYSTSLLFSNGREIIDTIRRFQSLDDWRRDEEANSTGREGARSMPGKSCQEICARYRPNGLPSNY